MRLWVTLVGENSNVSSYLKRIEMLLIVLCWLGNQIEFDRDQQQKNLIMEFDQSVKSLYLLFLIKLYTFWTGETASTIQFSIFKIAWIVVYFQSGYGWYYGHNEKSPNCIVLYCIVFNLQLVIVV